MIERRLESLERRLDIGIASVRDDIEAAKMDVSRRLAHIEAITNVFRGK